MAYLACATYPDTDHVRDAILALRQYGVPAELCSFLWLQAQEEDERSRDLAASTRALAPVAIHATGDGPVGTAGALDPPLQDATRDAPPGRGWLARLLQGEGVAADEAMELERRVLGGEVLLTVRAAAPSAALDQLLAWTGAFRFRPLQLIAVQEEETLMLPEGDPSHP